MRENRTHGSIGGCWGGRTSLRGPLVPGRCAETCHHDGSVGTSTAGTAAEPVAYLTARRSGHEGS